MCDVCGGEGLVKVDDGFAACKCVLVKKWFAQSGLMEHEQDISLDRLQADWGPDTANMLSQVAQVMNAQRMWLCMIGSSGVGKTTALMAITNFFCGRGIAARYYPLPDLFAFLKDGFNNDAYSFEARIDLLMKIPVLCIDEFDKQYKTEWANQELYRLVDRRWRLAQAARGQAVITVFAMNREPEDEYIRSRLMDRNFPAVKVYSPDARLTLPAQHQFFGR